MQRQITSESFLAMGDHGSSLCTTYSVHLELEYAGSDTVEAG